MDEVLYVVDLVLFGNGRWMDFDNTPETEGNVEGKDLKVNPSETRAVIHMVVPEGVNNKVDLHDIPGSRGEHKSVLHENVTNGFMRGVLG